MTNYLVDSVVLVASKVRTLLRGLMRVVGQRDDTYTVRDLTTNPVIEVHISRQRPLQYDPDHTELNEVATTDKQAFIVEVVKEHWGNPKKPTGMTFWVKGRLPEEENTWEPWKTMRLNGRSHTSAQKTLAKVVPKGRTYRRSARDPNWEALSC